jgi:DnaJ-class molecular chaperone
VTQILIALGALAGYAVFLLVKPEKTCRSCRGWGAKGRRRSYCTRCGGTGKRFRLGARLVHRAAAEAYRYARTRRLRESKP